MALKILLLDLRLRFISKLNFSTDYIFSTFFAEQPAHIEYGNMCDADLGES